MKRDNVYKLKYNIKFYGNKITQINTKLTKINTKSVILCIYWLIKHNSFMFILYIKNIYDDHFFVNSQINILQQKSI
jgi:hypothetical protein